MVVKYLSKYFRVKRLLVNQDIYQIDAYRIARLSKSEYEKALEFIQKGIPASKAADAAILAKESNQKIIELLQNEKICNYYISDIASLNEKVIFADFKSLNIRL